MANNRIGKKELLELTIEQEKKIQQLNQIIEEQKAALEDRRIQIEKSGSIAEACLSLNHVFEAADAAIKQYAENVSSVSFDVQGEYDRIIEKAQEEAEEILDKARAKARQASAIYMREAKKKVKEYYAAHPEYMASLNHQEETKDND